MSCNRQCFNPDDKWFEHEDCSTCSGKDDGASKEEQKFRFVNWKPHADLQQVYAATPATQQEGNTP